MRKLSVAASKNYDILIGNGLLPQLGGYVKALEKIQTVALVSETTVYPLFGQAAEKSLADAGFQVKSFVFSAGEASKCADTYLKLLTFLARNHLTRTDAIVALGGGVVGDLAGFAAATYLRGIRFVQVPTTLLAAVDSSVGGKTAIDLPEGKNLVGAFWQPSLVLCDTACLDTLPKATFRDGCAEVIKYGILFDRDFFDYLSGTGMEFDREYVIERCVAMKRDVVDRDEFDVGTRKLLNLGHTIGHSVEANSRFTLSHGQSVAIGTAIVARAAAAKKILSTEDCGRILKTLRAYGLPVETGDDPEILAGIALSDKKRSGGTLDLIVPEAIGSCKVLPVPVSDVLAWIQEGM
jgi:3-dehydroquinate synthase